MRRITWYLTLTLALLAAPMALVQAAGDLDNSAWHMSEKGKKGTADTLLFINGQFISSECVPYGFTGGSYTSSAQGDGMVWSSTQMNSDNEKMDWKGEVKGKQITGSYSYLDKKGKTSVQEWTAQKVDRK